MSHARERTGPECCSCMCSPGDWTRGLRHRSPALYQVRYFPQPLVSFFKIWPYNLEHIQQSLLYQTSVFALSSWALDLWNSGGGGAAGTFPQRGLCVSPPGSRNRAQNLTVFGHSFHDLKELSTYIPICTQEVDKLQTHFSPNQPDLLIHTLSWWAWFCPALTVSEGVASGDLPAL